MEFEFEYEEKEQFTNEEVQAILDGVKGQVEVIIKDKDETITGLTTEGEKVKELEESNHNLSIKNLAISSGISEDLFDLIVDEDLEVVKSKIELVKGLKQVADDGYKPTNKRAEDQYEKAINSKDVEGALKSKLGRLFG